MKKTLLLFVCVALTACQENPMQPTQSIQTNVCVDEQKLTDNFVADIKKIEAAATPPTKEEVLFLIKFLMAEFVQQDFDHGACQGFYAKIRSATLHTLKSREVEIRPLLQEIINEPYLGPSRDLMAQAAMQQHKEAAQTALNILDGHE